jgi:hypothetical protein
MDERTTTVGGHVLTRLNRKADAHDDYLSAIEVMAVRQKVMGARAQRGDDFARGYMAALHEFSLAVQASLARRIGA